MGEVDGASHRAEGVSFLTLTIGTLESYKVRHRLTLYGVTSVTPPFYTCTFGSIRYFVLCILRSFGVFCLHNEISRKCKPGMVYTLISNTLSGFPRSRTMHSSYSLFKVRRKVRDLA